MTRIGSILVVGIVGFALAGMAGASVLTGSVDTNPPTHADLTAAGGLDWAIWDYTSSSAVASLAPSNTKSGGPGIISSVTAVSGNVRGVTGEQQYFTYTDGTSPTSVTDDQIGAAIHATLEIVGEGVIVQVTGDPLATYQVSLWATGGNGAEGILTASLSGADDVVLATRNDIPRTAQLFTYSFRPDSAGDRLTLTLLNQQAGGYAFVGYQALAVSVVPEPATLSLLAVGTLAMLSRRRRPTA